MKFAWGAALGLAVVVALPAQAASISTSTKTYAISGETGKELMRSMDRRGPKHGFLSRAIAQTQYSVRWDMKVGVKNGACRVQRARAIMQMTFVYPEPSGPLSPAMTRKWNAFMVGVRKHEQQHGVYARQMVAQAERSVAALRVANDPSCAQASKVVKLRVREIYEEFEAKQRVFDKREHRQGANIYRLVMALTK